MSVPGYIGHRPRRTLQEKYQLKEPKKEETPRLHDQFSDFQQTARYGKENSFQTITPALAANLRLKQSQKREVILNSARQPKVSPVPEKDDIDDLEFTGSDSPPRINRNLPGQFADEPALYTPTLCESRLSNASGYSSALTEEETASIRKAILNDTNERAKETLRAARKPKSNRTSLISTPSQKAKHIRSLKKLSPREDILEVIYDSEEPNEILTERFWDQIDPLRRKRDPIFLDRYSDAADHTEIQGPPYALNSNDKPKPPTRVKAKPVIKSKPQSKPPATFQKLPSPAVNPVKERKLKEKESKYKALKYVDHNTSKEINNRFPLPTRPLKSPDSDESDSTVTEYSIVYGDPYSKVGIDFISEDFDRQLSYKTRNTFKIPEGYNPEDDSLKFGPNYFTDGNNKTTYRVQSIPDLIRNSNHHNALAAEHRKARKKKKKTKVIVVNPNDYGQFMNDYARFNKQVNSNFGPNFTNEAQDNFFRRLEESIGKMNGGNLARNEQYSRRGYAKAYDLDELSAKKQLAQFNRKDAYDYSSPSPAAFLPKDANKNVEYVMRGPSRGPRPRYNFAYGKSSEVHNHPIVPPTPERYPVLPAVPRQKDASPERNISRNSNISEIDLSKVKGEKNGIHIYSYGPLNISNPNGESPPEGRFQHDQLEGKPPSPSKKQNFIVVSQVQDSGSQTDTDKTREPSGIPDAPGTQSVGINTVELKDASTDTADNNNKVTQTSFAAPTPRRANTITKKRKPNKIPAIEKSDTADSDTADDIAERARALFNKMQSNSSDESEDEDSSSENEDNESDSENQSKNLLMVNDTRDFSIRDEDVSYVFSFITENGAVIGPMIFNTEKVEIGFGKAAEGLRNRISSPNDVNEFSSRSHTMLQLMIDTEIPDPEDENLYITKHGKLTFVDLAGSEKVKDSTVEHNGTFMTESNNINKSLLVLGKCISSLADSKKRGGHIPYRDSKLTKLLADSLGGSGVTLMIACVSPSSNNASETMNTLRYANRAKRIKNNPIIRMDPREKLILSLKRELKILRQENHYLRQQLNFPDKPRGRLQQENDAQLDQVLQNIKENAIVENPIEKKAETNRSNEEIKKAQEKENTSTSRKAMSTAADSDLYEMLQEYMVENETLRHENNDLNLNKEKFHRDQQYLSRENERLARRLEDIERLMSSGTGVQSPIDRRNGSREFNPPPLEYRNGNSPPGNPQGARPAALPIHSPRKPPHRLSEPIQSPRASNNSYPGPGYAERHQRASDQQKGPETNQHSPNRSNQRLGPGEGNDDPTHSSRRNPANDQMQSPSRTQPPKIHSKVNPRGSTNQMVKNNEMLQKQLDSINKEIAQTQRRPPNNNK